MKYLKKFNEALKPSQFRKYVKEFDKERYYDIFKEIGDKYEHDKNYYRVYIPLEKDEIKGYISTTHEEVDKFLNDNNCQLIDYVKGKAKFKDSKNETTIGKLLTRFKNDRLNTAFVSDEKRKALMSDDDFLVVISRHPYDIAGSDTDRNWTNCMTIGTDKSNRLTKLMDEYERTKNKDIKYKIDAYKQTGVNVKYLIHEVKEGSLISYLVKSNDRNINNPFAVLNIKPYSNVNMKNLLYTSKNMYGTKRPEFKKNVDNILEEYFNKNIGGEFKLNKKVYNDADVESIFRFDGLSIDEICKLLKIHNYKINNGLVDVEGDVDLSGKELTKIPLNFGNVTGDFGCFKNKLISLEGAPKSVGGCFSCYSNNLTSLKGSPKSVGSFYCSDNELISLEGCPENIGPDSKGLYNFSHFNCRGNNLTSLKGCPKSVGGNFNCSDNNLTSLEGCPKSVGGDFNCDEVDVESIMALDIKIGNTIWNGRSYIKSSDIGKN